MGKTKQVEDEISEAVRAMPRVPMPPHAPSEFEVKRTAIEYAPPARRDDFVEAASEVDLPAERMKVVEQGLMALQQAHADRDRLRRENGALRVRIAELEARIKAKESEEHVIEQRVVVCLDQRDHAVAEASELRGVLSSLAAILVGHYKPERHAHEREQQVSPVVDQPTA